MALLLLAAVTALLSGAVSWWLAKRFARYGSTLFAIPLAILFGLSVVTAKVVERFATCSSPDCGQLMFAAIAIISGGVSMSGFFGSLGGILLAKRPWRG